MSDRPNRILIVEDEAHIAEGLRFNFEAEGYAATVVADGQIAWQKFAEADPPFDLVVLDLMLPGMSGYDVCAAIRKNSPLTPVIVLSARTLPEDKIRAFDLGIDQYVTKPFNLPELLARVRNLLERRSLLNAAPAGPTVDAVVRFGSAQVNFRTHEVLVDDQPIKLTHLELKLLQLFVEHEGTVLSRYDILDQVWNNRAQSTRTVDNFVMGLRRHFEADPSNPRHFLSVRGAGYRFVATPEADESDSE